jgi:hypothetical protein
MKVWVRYCIFGSLSDKDWEEFDVDSEKEAEDLAYDLAVGEYESYE